MRAPPLPWPCRPAPGLQDYATLESLTDTVKASIVSMISQLVDERGSEDIVELSEFKVGRGRHACIAGSPMLRAHGWMDGW